MGAWRAPWFLENPTKSPATSTNESKISVAQRIQEDNEKFQLRILKSKNSWKRWDTLSETNIAPENGWLEY